MLRRDRNREAGKERGRNIETGRERSSIGI